MTGDDAVHAGEWCPDVLGAGWSARTVELRPDAQGPAVATLVRRDPDRVSGTTTGPATGATTTGTAGAGSAVGPHVHGRRAVLYVHGFVDYFFQTHVGEAFAAHGADFFALDLRGHGRSLRPWQEPNYVTDLAVYAEELDAAAHLLLADHSELVLLGHSTGGLVAALWADARRDAGILDALVLNSPWLDLRGSWFERSVASPVIDVVGRVAPRLRVSSLGEHYGAALHRSSGGEWGYDLRWKPHQGFPVRAGWLRAVRAGHARVARGLAIDCPVLVLSSDSTGPDDRWHPGLVTTDSVLDVAQIAARAPLLGRDVTLVQVPGGAHDLALSPSPARERYLDEMLRWLSARLGD